MRYLTATIGALFVFAGAFILTSIVVVGWVPVLIIPVTFAGFTTNNPVGLALSVLAAISSFAATLRRHRKQKSPPPLSPS